MPYASRKQQAMMNARAKTSPKWRRLAHEFNKTTYKGKGGSAANKRRYASLRTRARKKKS
jgi:hypothetical protein